KHQSPGQSGRRCSQVTHQFKILGSPPTRRPDVGGRRRILTDAVLLVRLLELFSPFSGKRLPNIALRVFAPLKGANLTSTSFSLIWWPLFWGRTGFDFADTPEAACRGWFVGLVNHRTKTKLLTKN